ncbi:hypothetical protein SAMN05421810_103524 [Amycolatopsis arida]|uniref:Uncharacterized protein n=1 Tax=Amycolatopsis arida TaxID=587909 RepID=A0A1I5TGU1_9PSEU|nr:hypothetical protein [Amycolatopsis arida]TDX96098.1 hypothetical protein CLV69_103233 [Amycolatopsis arida]SFP82253.1 hypothetical protein SAMN05421810_103524 [Amycolatopsis arida]
MSVDQPGPEMALVRYLRARGFTVEAGERPGDYRVTAYDGEPMPLRPRLSLPDDLLTEYLDEMGDDPAVTGGLGALSLTEVHLEEALTAGVGENRTTAVGVRRVISGEVEFFWHRRAPSEPLNSEAPSADLEWRADRPR